ncbi:unnamed protein product [Durusdinium trenchii]
MTSLRLKSSLVVLNSVINACAQAGKIKRAEQWLRNASSMQLQADVLSFNGIMHACAVRGQLSRAEELLEQLVSSHLDDIYTYNSLINACVESGETERAEHWLEQIRLRRLQPNRVSFSSLVKGAARIGDVEEMQTWFDRMWEAGIEDEMVDLLPEGPARTGSPLRKALYRFRSFGEPELVEVLESALELQWLHGYPRVPAGEPQLTHGTYKYLSGMQPLTVRRMLDLVPAAGTILDPFCGSGAVLIEALAQGKSAIGCDALPLAVFVSYHHCDAGKPDLDKLKVVARDVAKPTSGKVKDWQSIQEGVKRLSQSPEKNALWFALVVGFKIAAQGSADVREDAGGSFMAAVHRYASRVQDLREMSLNWQSQGSMGRLQLYNCDVRHLCLGSPVDAILTSPPYPGVYNYLPQNSNQEQQESDKIEAAALQDFGRGAQSSSFIQINHFDEAAHLEAQEIGARRSWASCSMTEYFEEWQSQQEQWMRLAHSCLKPGGSATLMIGNGDSSRENGFDNLSSTVAAAEAVGFEMRGWATIESCADETHRTKGMQRTEHMLHLVKEFSLP